ncbi:hypothetical protein ACWEK5_32680 [Rhodococcus koreensis]
MSPKQFLGTVSTALLIAGFLALVWGVNLGYNDRLHREIQCGNALVEDYELAEDADYSIRMYNSMSGRDTDEHFVDDCKSTRTFRQALGWPLAIVGAIGLLGVAVIRPTNTPSPQPLAAPNPGEPPYPAMKPIEK